ncbi:MAG: hypothetical protein KZQ60_13290, partial [Candidatus Thiodiazotropha sp. (ex Lucinoma aequizonata)]|nr:hypothetical protein [Candidatus Thiodiazotropha sp. (ex Lucinoma aequizonata)]
VGLPPSHFGHPHRKGSNLAHGYGIVTAAHPASMGCLASEVAEILGVWEVEDRCYGNAIESDFTALFAGRSAWLAPG